MFKTNASANLLNTYTPASKVLTTVPKGTYIKATKYYEAKGYYYFTYNNISGWIHKVWLDKVNVASGTEVRVNVRLKVTTQCSLRAIYSGGADSLAQIPVGSILNATMQYVDFYKVMYNGKAGWVHKNFVEKVVVVNNTTTGQTSSGGTTTDSSTLDIDYVVSTVEGFVDTMANKFEELKQAAQQSIYDSSKSYTMEEINETVNSNEELLTLKEQYMKEYQELFTNIQEATADEAMTAHMNGIYGMPYQFSSLVDPKVEGTDFGWKFTEKIVSRMPLLILNPGKVEYMPGQNKMAKVAALTDLINSAANLSVTSDLEEILNGNGKYYGFKNCWADYFNFVNEIAHAGAAFLGIKDVTVRVGNYTSKLSSFKWEKAMTTKFGSFLNAAESIVFYIDGLAEVSDAFTNNTTESQLASKVNSFSSLGKEVSFLLGTQAGVQFEMFDDIDKMNTAVNGIAEQWFNGNQLFKDIAGQFATVASGGKLMFPEIWDDSKFNRSFSISMKLRTPDCDPLSWYLNIYIPICMLISLTGPQQNQKNGYYSPFLVKGCYKGLFNIDMGIVTDLTFSKGKEGSWTLDGLPTEVDVSMTISDLYQSVLSIVSSKHSSWFLQNTVLMDYIANLCGVNINQPDVVRTVQVYSILKSDEKFITNKLSRLYNKVMNGTSNLMYKMYSSLSGSGL